MNDLNKQTCRIAVVGATGLVGETMLEILAGRNFPARNVTALASANSVGREMDYARQTVPIDDLDEFDFSQADIALFSAGSDVARQYAPEATAAGCTVIDNSSCFRSDDATPLVVPEINGDLLDELPGNAAAIIANPNCSTIQMVMALAPIHRAAGIARINVCTYQSVSGAGRKAVEELAQQTSSRLNLQAPEHRVFPQIMAFNVLPQIDAMQDNGYSGEEMKMVHETRKILRDDSIQINPTAVRVPVFFGHALAVHLETVEPITIDIVLELLQAEAGIKLMDKPGQWPTPVKDAAGKDAVYIGRVRRDISHPNGLDMWVVADNIRKGAALNAVQIAEYLLRQRADKKAPATSADTHSKVA